MLDERIYESYIGILKEEMVPASLDSLLFERMGSQIVFLMMYPKRRICMPPVMIVYKRPTPRSTNNSQLPHSQSSKVVRIC